MNADHSDDSLLIARAFAEPAGPPITDAAMTGFDGDAGVWAITRDGRVSELRIPWPGGPIADRAAVRREIVALYDAAASLGG
jgi:hypothetical protein